MSDVPRMMRDILDQPESLKQVLDHQFGRGAHALEQAADTIRSVPTIIVTGMGASLYGAMPLAYQLNSIGRACQVVEAGELLHFGGDLPRGALVIIVSRSGETVEAVNLLPKLTAARAHVIAVTNDRTSRLAREADLALCVNSRADEAVAIQSYTGTAMLSLLLAAEVMGRDLREQADAVVETCRTTLEREQDQEWNEFLDRAKVVYLLGRGSSLASVYEGALLFNETAKLPSVAMAAGGFRHGPVEVVDADFRAVLFRSEPATEHLDGALGVWIEGVGGRVKMVSSAPGFFSPLAEIIPVQFAAFHAANQRDITPGKFRYVSLVTTSETDFKADGA